MKDVVCVGGWATGPAIWEPLLAMLGWSDRAERVPWWEDLGPALARMDSPCLLVGWSMGSLRVLEAALGRGQESFATGGKELRLRPLEDSCPPRGFIRGIILLSATARQTADADYPGMPPAMLRAMRRRLSVDREAVLKAFFGECLRPEIDSSQVAALCREADPIPTDTLAAGLDYLIETDLRASLAGLTVPALILHGEADAVVPPACGAFLTAGLARATWLPLPSVGHLLPWRSPELVVKRIHDWTGKNDSR